MMKVTADELMKALRNIGCEEVDAGSNLFQDFEETPEIGIRINGKRFGIERIEGIAPETDKRIAREVKRKQRYYKVKKMPVLWLFTPGRETDVPDNRQLFLWESEIAAANRTKEDSAWELRANGHIRDASFFQLFDYEPDSAHERVLVNSITEASVRNGEPVFRTKRFLVDRKDAPIRAFLLWQSPWLALEDLTLIRAGSFVCGNSASEEAARVAFDRDVQNRQA
ncbi:hypothetical protein [Salisediminibacterium selenitireducens]|uniref:Uncharacterized protein n=1 Tax=Bacillus selenitireducens (strain ATCC 700615 / DSM 15326 / MLS10) TaxID=439292 RepID=D6XZK1_BACIE|nr:hypothetical protein [Salisediminibacterium selenitireducens]ADH98375.1 hypothetical protein Bsel_0849 [[Bacillus] selenitireducens MLS10]